MTYLPLTDVDRSSMLKDIGVKDFDQLIASIPSSLRYPHINIPVGLCEYELSQHVKELASKNQPTSQLLSFLGAGAYDHYIPSVVDHLVSRSEFYTAYTPYQAEASQGLLQSIYEYQTVICRVTGMQVANASHYDGATSMVEAALMATSLKKRNKILVAETVHPEYRQVLETYLFSSGIEIIDVPMTDEFLLDESAFKGLLDSDVACFIVQSPNFMGVVENYSRFSELVHANGSLLIAVGNLLSYTKYISPAEFGADIACGDAQIFGSNLNFGGPYVGYLGVTKKLMRKICGRLAGMTVDKDGNRAFVLTLQAREQHIRREKATSNICSNQALCALSTVVHVCAIGQKGLEQVFDVNRGNSEYLRSEIVSKTKCRVSKGPMFNEFVVTTNLEAEEVRKLAKEQGIIPGFLLSKVYNSLKNSYLVCSTEKKSKDDLDRLVKFFSMC